MIMSMYVCMHVYVHVCAYGFLYWVNDFITAWSKFKYWSTKTKKQNKTKQKKNIQNRSTDKALWFIQRWKLADWETVKR